MRRRDFIAGLGSTPAWPISVRAQQMQRIGVLMPYADNVAEPQGWVAAFREELAKLGWTEGRNVQVDVRWAPEAAVTQRYAKELVAWQPGLVLAAGTPIVAALLRETRTIPIVFAAIADPVGSGFVANFARPGGNATGFTNMEATTAGKWLELLREAAPRVKRFVLLFNPATAPYTENFLGPFKSAATSFGVEAVIAPVRSQSEIAPTIAAQAAAANSGLIVMLDSFLVFHRVEVTSLALRHGLPLIAPHRFYTQGGGLLSYGNSWPDNFRRAAVYADRILKGAKPSELPVQAPVKFELVINLKTAKMLGLEVPPLLQQRADEVIE
jgi:putative ABC transport system substrate-binding protein